jgi:hypothetical protein
MHYVAMLSCFLAYFATVFYICKAQLGCLGDHDHARARAMGLCTATFQRTFDAASAHIIEEGSTAPVQHPENVRNGDESMVME